MADNAEILKRLEAELAARGDDPNDPKAVLDKIVQFMGGEGYKGPRRAEGSSLAVAPGTTPDQTSDIPRGMVFDPATGGYADTALHAERALARDPSLGSDSQLGAGFPVVGEYFDETVGLAGQAISGKSPEIGAEFTREIQKQYSAENPGKAIASRLGGGIVGSAGLLGAGKTIAANFPRFASWAASFIPANTTGQVIGGALVGGGAGAIEGGISGYGAGNDENRARTAGDYAGTGLMAGTAVGVAAPLATVAVSNVYNALKNNFAKVSARIPGLSPEASRLVRDVADTDIAGGGVRRNIGRAGPSAMIADAGPATQDLLDTSVAMSSAGRNAALGPVNKRAAGAVSKLTQTFDEVMGGPQGAGALRAAIDDATKPGIKAAYRDAYSQAVDYSTPAGQDIERIVSRIPKRIFDKAAAKATERMDWEEIPHQYLAQISQNGGVKITEIPSVIELDYLKRGLDDIINDGTDTVTGKLSSEAQLASRMKTSLRDALRRSVPGYGKALDEASDAFALNNALELGQKMLGKKVTREQIAEWTETATPVEKRALAAGLRSSIDETIANVKRSVTAGDLEVGQARTILRDMTSLEARSKILKVFGPAEARKLFKSMNEATQALSTQVSVAKNSQTAPRLRRDQMVKDAQEYSSAQIARDAASGSVVQAPQKVAQISAGNTPIDKQARTEKLYLEIAEYLTGIRGEAALAEAEKLIASGAVAPAQAAAGRAIGQGVGVGVGVGGYQGLTQPQRTGRQ